MPYFLFVFIGLFIGFGFSISFLRASKKIPSLFTSSGILFIINSICVVFKKKLELDYIPSYMFSIYLLLGISISFSLVVFFYYRSIKNYKPIKAKFYDLIFGTSEEIAALKKSRLKTIEGLKLRHSRLVSIKKEISARFARLSNLESEFKKNASEKLTLTIKQEHPYFLSNENITLLQECINRMLSFSSACIIDALEISSECNELSGDSKEEAFLAILNSICINANQYLLGGNVRSHFRKFQSNKHVAILAYEGRYLYDRPITPIKWGNSLIKAAAINRSSLVKSANLSYHKKCANDDVWKDYITTALFIDNNGKPALTFTISTRSERDSSLLYLYSYLGLGKIIEDILSFYDKKFDLSKGFIWLKIPELVS